MKKIIFLTLVVLFAINVVAQEVHGVESKMVCTYHCNPDGSWSSWSSCRRCDSSSPWFAYEFTNMNSIPVSVEVKLYRKESGPLGDVFKCCATKSFVLKSGESYIYKTEERGIAEYSGFAGVHSYKDYYVEYKAYKLL